MGTRGDDLIDGGAGADKLIGAYGNDTLVGGAGIDTAEYIGKFADYGLIFNDAGFELIDNLLQDGTDTLTGVERLSFSNGTVAMDINGNGGQAYRLYQAAFNRTPDGAGLGYWINALDKGEALASVAAGFVKSAEFIALYGKNPSNTELVGRYYQNVLHRPGEKAGMDYWVGILDSGASTPSQVLTNFSESAENYDAIEIIIGSGFVYTPYG